MIADTPRAASMNAATMIRTADTPLSLMPMPVERAVSWLVPPQLGWPQDAIKNRPV